MQQEKINQGSPIHTKSIIFGMVLMFVIVHVGFHATYIKYFPVFKDATWLHHIHGALMGAWVLLLLLQPILIHKKNYAAHRFIGKSTYVIAPIMIVSMLFVARYNYLTGIIENTPVEVFAWQSITWMQIFMFILFYSLAIIYRKDTPSHMRFIIATAIIMIGPAMGRIIFTYFDTLPATYDAVIPLYVKTGVAAAFLLSDIIKKKNWMPYFMVLLAFLLSDVVYFARYSDVWQGIGKFIANNFYY